MSVQFCIFKLVFEYDRLVCNIAHQNTLSHTNHFSICRALTNFACLMFMFIHDYGVLTKTQDTDWALQKRSHVYNMCVFNRLNFDVTKNVIMPIQTTTTTKKA